MRLYALLLLLAVTLAFSAGALSLSIRNAPRTTQGTVGDIVQLKGKFQREQLLKGKPEEELELSSLFPVTDFSQLVDPAYSLPLNRRFSFHAISKLYRYSRSCTGPIESKTTDLVLRKSWEWQQYKCGKLRRLPEYFFETPPFTFALGGSFSFLATQSPELVTTDRDWVQSHIRFFHVSELSSLGQFHVSLEGPRQALASLDTDSLSAIADGDEFILAKQLVLFRQTPRTLGNRDSSSYLGRANAYFAFRRQDWDTALAKSDYLADVLNEGQLCVLRDGQVCWRLGTDQVFRNIQMKSLALFIMAGLMAGICVWIAIRKFQQQNREEERKRFALQTLTHELRTPLASLVLSSEEVIDRFDTIPADLQGTMVRMCDDIQRLHRLAEISKHYLGSEDGGLIQFDFKAVPSINAYLSSVLESYEGKVVLKLLAQDHPFRLDPYWVGVCIKNLIENSLQHGRPPFNFTAEIRDAALELIIEDAGVCILPSLNAMTEAFTKGKSSRGLGLGLAIVRKVLDTMNADLSFAPNPTRFTVRIQEPGRTI